MRVIIAEHPELPESEAPVFAERAHLASAGIDAAWLESLEHKS
jgi:hypothetical protein